MILIPNGDGRHIARSSSPLSVDAVAVADVRGRVPLEVSKVFACRRLLLLLLLLRSDLMAKPRPWPAAAVRKRRRRRHGTQKQPTSLPRHK